MKKLLSILSIVLLFLIGLVTLSNPTFASNDSSLVFVSEKISAEAVLNDFNNGTIQPYGVTFEHHFLNKNNTNDSTTFLGDNNEFDLLTTDIKPRLFFNPNKKTNIIISFSDNEQLFDSQINPRAP